MQIQSQKNLRIPQGHIPAAFERVKQRFGQHSRELAEAQTLADCFAAWGFQTQMRADGSLAVTGYSGDGTDAERYVCRYRAICARRWPSHPHRRRVYRQDLLYRRGLSGQAE